MILGAEVEEIGIGEAHAIAGGVLFPEADNLPGIFVGQRAEENTVNDTEDGGGGADAESEGKNGDGGEGGRFFKEAEGEARVLEECFEKWKRALVANGFFGLLGTAEMD